MRHGMRRPTCFGHAGLAFGLACLVFSVGCGPSAAPQGTVKGKITTGGEAVNGGTVTFSPIGGGGKPASGVVQSDGTFVLSTTKEGDGAMIGKHQVTYSPAVASYDPGDWDGTGEPPKAPESPYKDLKVKQTEVEVKAGANDVAVELVPAA